MQLRLIISMHIHKTYVNAFGGQKRAQEPAKSSLKCAAYSTDFAEFSRPELVNQSVVQKNR